MPFSIQLPPSEIGSSVEKYCRSCVPKKNSASLAGHLCCPGEYLPRDLLSEADSGRHLGMLSGWKEMKTTKCRKLSVGEWVEVRSKEEILRTLDHNGRLDGMP